VIIARRSVQPARTPETRAGCHSVITGEARMGREKSRAKGDSCKVEASCSRGVGATRKRPLEARQGPRCASAACLRPFVFAQVRRGNPTLGEASRVSAVLQELNPTLRKSRREGRPMEPSSGGENQNPHRCCTTQQGWGTCSGLGFTVRTALPEVRAFPPRERLRERWDSGPRPSGW
jgi:hypothetical protein